MNRLLLAFASALLASPVVAQRANPESRPGPPPRMATVAPPCPNGEVYDLGVCVPRMSEEDGRQCRDAFDRAAGPAEDRVQLLEANCVVVPLPGVCAGLVEDFGCVRAICAAGDEVVRPAMCDGGDLEVIITPEMRCEFDAIAMVPTILGAMAPEARALTAEIAAIRMAIDTLEFDPAMVLAHHARQLDTALSARQSISTFLAVRFAICAE